MLRNLDRILKGYTYSLVLPNKVGLRDIFICVLLHPMAIILRFTDIYWFDGGAVKYHVKDCVIIPMLSTCEAVWQLFKSEILFLSQLCVNQSCRLRSMPSEQRFKEGHQPQTMLFGPPPRLKLSTHTLRKYHFFFLSTHLPWVSRARFISK